MEKAGKVSDFYCTKERKFNSGTNYCMQASEVMVAAWRFFPRLYNVLPWFEVWC